MNYIKLAATMFSIIFIIGSCSKDESFPALGDKFAGPIDVAMSSDESYFYVLNSDFDRTYNKGSIVVLNTEGEKVNSIELPRMGRSLTVIDNDLLVTFNQADAETNNILKLFDLTDPSAPVEVKSWTTPDCFPINVSGRSGYAYFALSCQNGGLFMGELKPTRSESTLTYVRKYNLLSPKRALYIDPSRNLLFAFTTDLRQIGVDIVDEDKISASDSGSLSDEENEIPDSFEKTALARKRKSSRERYQYIVYDIESEAAEGFPFRDSEDEVRKLENRYMYFTLQDGTEFDNEAGSTDLTKKFYRTNFWAAKPNPDDSDSFFLSHRGETQKGSTKANNIIKVSITADPKPSDGVAPATKDILSFERVYGFNSDKPDPDTHYPGDFEVLTLNSSQFIVVNHFKDYVNFRTTTGAAFSIAGRAVGDESTHFELTGEKEGQSFYQLASTSTGRALTCAFYGNAVILLDVASDTGITINKTIK